LRAYIIVMDTNPTAALGAGTIVKGANGIYALTEDTAAYILGMDDKDKVCTYRLVDGSDSIVFVRYCDEVAPSESFLDNLGW